jgi:DNA-binding transcriptional MerR regulator
MEPKRHWSLGGVASEVGVPRWRLAYLIERGVLPEASIQVPGRRLFTEEDVALIRAILVQQNGPSR